MSQLIKIESDRRDDILTEAADRQVPVVLSRQVGHCWATYKSRFLRGDSAGRFIVLAHPLPDPGQAPPELAPGERIGLTFRRGHKKCMCALEIDKLVTFEQNGMTVAGFQVPWPDKLQELQRRIYFRANVPAGRHIEVKVWEAGMVAERPDSWQAMPHHTGLLQNVSAGGCRVILDAIRDPQLETGDSVRIQFQPDPRSEPLTIEAMFRHGDEMPQRKLSLGFQFVGMELSAQGRDMLQALARVVSTFLRIENRRTKRRSHRKEPKSGNVR